MRELPSDTEKPSTNQALVEFSHHLLERLPIDVPETEIINFLATFTQLHELVNDPTNREVNAEKKAHLIYDLATAELAKRPNPDYQIKLLPATHIESGTRTYNVAVLIGHPDTGPTTVVEVHHDTIAAGNYDLQYDNNRQLLRGRTIQDNTAHAAATITCLSRLPQPEQGAFLLVFTDHEENGCRGSSALAPAIAQTLSPHHPATIIALESTNGELGTAHRGKLDAVITGQLPNTDIGTAFLDFYARLRLVQNNVYHQAAESALGPTSGTSTFGQLGADGLHAKLDFRTNEVVNPHRVLQAWQESITTSPPENQMRDIIANNHCQLTWCAEGIKVDSSSKITHPANYQPDQDETVLPTIAAITARIHYLQLNNKLTGIVWGSPQRPNSVPLSGLVQGSFSESDLQMILAAPQPATTPVQPISPYHWQLNAAAIAERPGISTTNQSFLGAVLQELQTNSLHSWSTTTLNFMTDAATLFNLLVENGRQSVNGLVWGVGDPSLLHSTEELSAEAVYALYRDLPKLLTSVQHNMTSHPE